MNESTGLHNQSVLTDKQPFEIGAASRLSFNYDTDHSCMLNVDVTEQSGGNLEFKIINNGGTVYSSGIFIERTRGQVRVNAGNISVVIINLNPSDSKKGIITVTTSD
jgi:hypothetical protein